VFLIGCYDVLCVALNSFKTQLEADVAPLDPEVKARMVTPSSAR